MKSNLAALVEALRILKISNFLNKKGRILITAHGLHEPPEGNSAPLISLIKKGIYGNSCIVAECAEDFLAIEGRGLAFFEFEIIGKEKNIHEITANFLLKENLINPLFVGFELLKLLFKQDNKIKTGSLFISIFHCGDEPNRFPNYCKIGGTRRYLPTEDFKLVYNEFEEIAKMLNQIFYPKVEIRFKVINRRESFHVSKDSKIVASLQKAYYKVTGTKLKEKMLNIVADAPYFANVAHIPVTYHGVDSRTAHSDLEFINIDDAVRASKVYIQTAIEFFTKN
jgi:acetylornithine deacetylase/succinyl-diaminopimelate desuccinylase-like protein